MPECGIPLLDLVCQAGEEAVLSPLESIARSVVEANLEFLRFSITWWIETDSISPDSGAVRAMQEFTMPVVALMLVGSVLVQAIRMTLARKKDPAINVALGLLRFAVVNAVGLTLLAAALRAGDAYAEWLVAEAGREYLDLMEVSLLGVGLPLMVVLSILGLVLSLIQFVLAFFRQAGILVLATMLPIAASGSINDATKVWMGRLVPWLVSLVLYKPMAAMIYAIGFELMHQEEDPFTVEIVGLFVILLAVVALPAMMRFFAWSQVSVTGGSGVAGSLASGARTGADIASLLAARRQQNSGPGSTPAESSAPSGATPTGPTPAPTTASTPAVGGPGAGTGPAVAGAVGGLEMARQATKNVAERFTSEVGSGANGAPAAGPPPRGRGAPAPSTPAPGSAAPGSPGPGPSPASGPTGSAPVAPGAAAGTGAAPAGPAGAAAAAEGARRGGQEVQKLPNKMTGEEQR